MNAINCSWKHVRDRYSLRHASARGCLVEPLEARISPANIVAHWIGGSGNWSDTSHWDIGAVPTNGGGNTYAVVIDVPAFNPVVIVDESIAINGLTNADVIHITTGTSTLSTSLVNTGSIDVTAAGTLDLTGAFTAPTFGSLAANGGLITVSGTIDLAGGVMPIAGTTGVWQLSGGTIKNGLVGAVGDTLALAGIGGTIDGVTINGNFTVTSSYQVTVKNGLTLNGTATLGGGNAYGVLDFTGNQTLGGNGTVVFSGTGLYDGVSLASGTLTIGSGITIHGQQGYVGYDFALGGTAANISVINRGTIQTDVNGGTITIDGNSWNNSGTLSAKAGDLTLTTSANSTNTGVLSVDPGSTLSVNGSFRNDDPGILEPVTHFDGRWS